MPVGASEEPPEFHSIVAIRRLVNLGRLERGDHDFIQTLNFPVPVRRCQPSRSVHHHAAALYVAHHLGKLQRSSRHITDVRFNNQRFSVTAGRAILRFGMHDDEDDALFHQCCN